MLRFTDTMSGRVVEFEPAVAGRVSIYACGPTVYDVPHLGHARTALTYDVIVRHLRWRGYDVTLVANVTDIDDKIIARARDEGTTEADVARRYEDVYIAEMRRLGIADPDHRPHATDYVDEMIAFVEELVDAGAAYVIEDAGVYFDVSAYADYGLLVHRSADDLREGAGARVDVDERKDDPLDFALWKAAKPGEPAWASPWMPGRPGWHIECVAMSLGLLGDGFDIHGGGSDLVFPHHENERAESEAAGHSFARHWLHSAMVNIEGEKMAKSAGNFVTLGDVLDAHDPRALRLAMLQTHYRSTMEISDAVMASATAAVERLDAFERRLGGLAVEAATIDEEVAARFAAAMDEDFATPAALAIVFETVRSGHSALDSDDRAAAATALATVRELSGVLGIEGGSGGAGEDGAEIDELVAARQQARAERDFAEADRIRDELHTRGIEVEDTPDGPVWHRTG
jgi:cysteinyl-tRNA synthetase